MTNASTTRTTTSTTPTELTIDQLRSLLNQLEHQQAGAEPTEPEEGTMRQAGGQSFKLDTGQLAGILTSRGRRAMLSVYHDDILTAIANPGTYYGIQVTPTLKAAWIISQIRKAAREAGLNTRQYSTYNRENEGFVSYVVHHPVSRPETVRSDSENGR